MRVGLAFDLSNDKRKCFKTLENQSDKIFSFADFDVVVFVAFISVTNEIIEIFNQMPHLTCLV